MKNKKRVVKFKPFAQLKTGVRSVSINTYKDSKGKDIFTSTFYSPSDNAFVTVKSKDVNSTVKAVKHIYYKSLLKRKSEIEKSAERRDMRLPV